MLIVLDPQIPFAGEYKLATGQGKPICNAYRENLEPRHDDEPMACECRYDAPIRGFSSPDWRKLDVASNIELLRKGWVTRPTMSWNPRVGVLARPALQSRTS